MFVNLHLSVYGRIIEAVEKSQMNNSNSQFFKRIYHVHQKNPTPSRFIALLLLLAATQVAHANCYAIHDADLKNYCLAKVKSDANICYSIREADAKNFCLAEVKKMENYCYSIRNSDQKNYCLTVAK